MNLETVYSHNKLCPVRSLGDGQVIMAPSGDTTHSLEEIGVFIWNQLDGQKNLQNVLDAILEEYDVNEDEARTDLLEFVAQMQASDLILET